MYKSNVNSGTMKDINKRLVLNTIRKFEPISRKQLAEKTGLTQATITNITNELTKGNYLTIIGKDVSVAGKDVSVAGRKQILLGLNEKAGYVIGIELNTFEVICLLVDFKANILSEITVTITLENGKEEVFNTISDTIKKIIEESYILKEEVKGIGIVSAGPYDQKKGIMINPPNFPGWDYVPIKDIVEQAVGIPVCFEKETAASALGEYWFGDAGTSASLFLTNIYDVGIGGGFVINGSIYHGFKYGASDIGHMCVDLEGLKCTCGCVGCLETVADGAAAVREVKSKLKMMDYKSVYGIDSLESVNLSFVIENAENNDLVCIDVLMRCAKYMGKAISNVINMISPDTIVLSGEFVEKSKLMVSETIRQAKTNVYPGYNKEVNIYKSKLGKRLPAMGGVAIVFDQLFNK